MTETTHEALVRQTGAAEELLDYFQGNRVALEARQSAAEAQFAAWRQDKDTLGDPDYQGSLRVGVLQGQIHNTGGGVVAANAIGTLHFSQYGIDAGTSTNVYMHIKTGIDFGDGDRKFSYQMEGYAYGQGALVEGKISGFINGATGAIQAMEAVGTHGLTAYKMADNKLAIRMLFPSTYLLDFRMDTFHVGWPHPALGSLQPVFSTLGSL